MGFHIDMETERLMREERLSPEEARRRALATFGGVTQHREALRDGRGLAWLAGMSLDFKLGVPDAREVSGADDRRRAGDGVRHLGRRDRLRDGVDVLRTRRFRSPAAIASC